MTEDQRKKLFAEILQKELNKVFLKHIEDLKNAYVSQDPPHTSLYKRRSEQLMDL